MTETINRLRFPGLRFPVPLVATLALLAILGALLLPGTARAQAATVLVSNLGQDMSEPSLGGTLSDRWLAAQAFSVPSGGGDYTLTSIEIPFSENGIPAADIDSLSVSVWSASSSGHPSSSLYTLVNPASITANTTATFNAPSGMTLTLAAGDTYVVVVHHDKEPAFLGANPLWLGTQSDDEDASSTTDWTIANKGLRRENTATSWSDKTYAYGIGVNGTAASGDTPTLSTDATLSALSLGSGVTLDPTFASGTYAYTASVANSVDEVTVAPTTTDTDATFEYLDSSDNTLADADSVEDGHQVDLDVGDTVFKVKVTAEDTTTTQTYTVTVTRAACTLETGDIWCGVVTVGEYVSGGITFAYGFVDATTDTGALSDTTFDVSPNSYTIDRASVGVGGNAGILIISLTSALTEADRTKLVLQVDGSSGSFAFDGVTPTASFGYRWEMSGLDWSSETSVTLRLRDTPVPCTLETGDIWCGVVTVAEIERSGSTFAHGFIDITGLSAGTFAGETDIPVGSNTYTFLGLYVPVTGSFDGRVTLRANDNFTIAEQATLELHIDVDGTANTLVMSGFEDSTNGQMIAPGTDSDWSSATTVTARLRPLTQGPTITDVAITSTPVLETDTYGAGETIEVSVTFSEAVTVTGEPHVEYNFAGTTVEFPYESGSGTTALVFAYTVAPSDEDDNGIFKRPNGLKVGTGESIVSAAGVAADLDYEGGDSGERDHKVDGSRSIVSVEVTSTPQLETDTYGAGETILFTVTFTAKVDVTGDPVLEFLFDGSEVRQASDVSGGGTTELVFSYTVVSGDDDDNGLFLRDESDYNNPDGPVRLDSDDEIEFHGTSTDAPLYWAGRGTQSGHKVDGSRTTGNVAPSFSSSATFDAAENQFTAGTVLATDSDADDEITGYAITGGADQAFFSSVTNGLLTFDAAPNYEDAKDQGTNNTYVVDVTATSGTGTRVKTATQTITVTVTNVDEDQSGTVTIDDTTPMVDDELTASTASVADPDGLPDPFAPTWKWYRTPDGGSETEITGETSATYTVVATDLGATLTAKARWTDNGGFANTLSSAPTSAVAAASALPTLSIGNASATEGSLISFPLTLSATASESVTVTCTASLASGDTGETDDLALGSARDGIVLAGQTAGICTIPTSSDTTDEDDETFTVTLSNVSSNAQLATDPTAKGTILDDDDPVDDDNAAPSFSSSAARHVAENTTAVVTVTATDSDTDDDVTGYEITGGADQGFFSIGATSGVLTFKSAPNFEDRKDSGNDNDYVVVVQATSGAGTREKTATQTITVTVTDVTGEAPGKPAKPAKPRVSAASATSLRVNWSAPSNAGPAITDYDVQYRAGNSGGWSDASHTGTARATTLTRLTEDTPYQVQVRATNAEGTGAWSDSVSGTPAEEDDLPADTTTTGVVEVNGSAVRGDIHEPVEETVTWTIINTVGEEEVVEGTVYDFDTDWFAVELEKDKTYRIDMKGAIHVDDDDLSLRLPQIIAIFDSKGNFLVNTWSRDESDSHYLFRVTFHAHFHTRGDATYYIAASGESFEWGTYELRVKDITEDDDEHTNAQRGPQNLSAVEEKGGVRLTWQPPDGAAVTGYRIERRRADEQGSGPQRSHGQPRDHHTLVEDTGNTETSYVDESAEQGVEYEYRVTARNESGPGESSDWVRAGPEEEPVLGDGLPGAPRNLTATPGNKEVTLSWDPPDDNGNPPATRYRIEWRVDGKDYHRNDWGTSQETTYTTNAQANLANGVKYVFRVKAENDDGNSYGPYGPASEEVSATPTSGSAVDLDTPVLSDTENLHHGMVKLDWQDIEDAGWYVVQYYHLEDEEWLDLPAEGVDIAFHGSSAVVSNLHGLSWLRVGAASCDGASEWSQIEELYGTNASDWEGVPVPEVEEGDQIEPCPVVWALRCCRTRKSCITAWCSWTGRT